MDLSRDDILEILKVLDTTELGYFELRIGDTVIIAGSQDAAAGAMPVVAAVTPPSPAAATGSANTATPAVPPTRTSTAAADEADLVEVTAPVLGVFYQCPEPGAAPFVEVGSQVNKDDTVGLLEVMKMFNAVTAGVTGTVAAVLVDNGTFVEFGQPLLRVRPSVPA